MEKKINHIWKKVFIGLLTIACFGTFLPNQTKAEEQLQLATQVVLSEDASSADIAFDVASLGEKKSVHEIKASDGKIIEIAQNAKYNVKANGTYAFDVQYLEGETTKSFRQEVVVDGIQKKAEETSETKVEPVQGTLTFPRANSNASGDRLTTTFQRDSGAAIDWTSIGQLDWNYYDTELVEVNAVFSEVGSAKTRTIEIDIPQGYQLLAYSAKDGTAPQYEEQILQTTEATQQGMISSLLTAQNGGLFGRDKFANGYVDGYSGISLNMNLKSGKIIYTFNTAADKVQLSLKLGIDKNFYNYSDTQKMYATPDLTSEIGTSSGDLFSELSVKLTSGTYVLEDSVKANVKGTYNTWYLHRGTVIGNVNTTYIDSDNKSPIIMPYGEGFIYTSNSNASNVTSYLEELIIVYHYPVGTTYMGTVSSSINANLVSEVNDTTARTVTITYKNIRLNTTIYYPKPKFQLSGDVYGLAAGKTKSAPFQLTLAMKTEGDSDYQVTNKMHYNATTLYTSIIDKNLPMTVRGYSQQAYDYTEKGFDKYQFLGTYDVENPAPLEKNDLDLDWKFGEGLGMKVLRFGMPKDSILKNIKVYTNTNPAGHSVPNITSSVNGAYGAIFDADTFGLAEGEYVTRVTGVISKYPGYFQGATYIGVPWASTIDGYAAYGKITNGTGGIHTLSVGGVSASSVITTTTTKNTPVEYTNTGALSQSYFPGNKVPINVGFSAGPNSNNRDKRATQDFLENPYTYIRVPKGFSLDEASLKFYFLGDITDKAILKSKTTATDGAIIYKYGFDDPFTVMAGTQTKNNANKIIATANDYYTVKFDLIVTTDNQGVANLQVRDILMLDNKGGDFVGYDDRGVNHLMKDIYNVTGNPAKTLYVADINRKFSVVKTPQLNVYSGIRVKGDTNDFYQYNGSTTSIASLSKDRIAEIQISYLNTAVTKYDNTNIYFPIPKEGKDYGKYFNNKEVSDPGNIISSTPFEWSANLMSEVSVPGFTTLYAVDGVINTTTNTGALDWEPFIPTTQWYTYAQLSAAGKNIEDVVFMKFSANQGIGSGASGAFTFDLQVDDSAKMNLVNFWRTYTGAHAEGSSTNTWTIGSAFAATLSAGSLDGLVFYDLNGNGVYDTGDLPYTGSDITLQITEKDGKIPSTPLLVNPTTGKYEMNTLREGEYSITALNATAANLHFTQTQPSTATVIGSNVVANAGNTQAKVGGLIINSAGAATIKNVGVGIVPISSGTYQFEDNVQSNAALSGLVSMSLGSDEAQYDGSFGYGPAFSGELIASEPTITIDPEYVFTGWNIYVVDGAGIEKKMGSMIPVGSLNTATIPALPMGSTMVIKGVVAKANAVVITAEDLEVYVGDDYEELAGLSAVNELGTAIPLSTAVGATKNTRITHNIPMSAGNYTQAGTYLVEVEVTDLATNKTAVEERLVRVNDLPVVEADYQRYHLEDANAIAGVESNPTATWKQAGVNAGDVPQEVSIAQVNYSVKRGPSTDFSVIGIYEVTYQATNADGKIGTKPVKVLIVSENAVKDLSDTLMIDAYDFTLENHEAKALSQANASTKKHGNASAFEDKKVAGTTVDYSNISDKIKVDAAELAAIQGAPKAGGVYPLTYMVEENGISVTKKIMVTVKPLLDEDGNPSTDSEDSGEDTTAKNEKKNGSISTGDATNIQGMVMLLILAGGILVYSKRRQAK